MTAVLVSMMLAWASVAMPAGPPLEQGVLPQSIILNNEHSSGSFQVPPEVLKTPPAKLAIQVTKVVNPKQTPIAFFVYLRSSKQDQGKKLVGNFALFPADQPGTFLLDPSKALRFYRTMPGSAEVRLIIELKRVNESQPWTPIEVTVAPPIWSGRTP